MTTTSASRSIEIDAPVERVFEFLADPENRVGTFAGRGTVISDVETSQEGVVTSYRWTSHVGPLPLRGGGTPKQITNQRIVDGNDTWTLEPSGTGTKLLLEGEFSTRIPLLDKVGVFIATGGKGQGRTMEAWLTEIKRQVEAAEK